LVVPGVSLIRATYNRLTPFARPEDIFISTGEIYTEKTLNHCPIPAENLVLEPARRNNAPAIGLSLVTMLERGATEDDVVVLFPADHIIANNEYFTHACLFSEKIIQANPGAVLTWGIEPTYPETGYGYIEKAPQTIGKDDEMEAFSVISFKEKPPIEIAREYVDSGKYFWNAGIFFFRLGSMLANYEKYLPEMHTLLIKIKEGIHNGK
jgi:mannose-1-phosphate guanylyltransferase